MREPEPGELTQSEKRSKVIASMCLNISGRPSSRASSADDEGGFNEPSPEIKARLKPTPAPAPPAEAQRYSFQPPKAPDLHFQLPGAHPVLQPRVEDSPEEGVITNSVLAELESHDYRPLYIETVTPKTEFTLNSDNLNTNNKISTEDALQTDTVSTHQQDSGVLVSEGSMEVLDKSVNSQWSMQSDGDLLHADSAANLTSSSSLLEYERAEASVLEDGSDDGGKWDGEGTAAKGPESMTPDEAELMLSCRLLLLLFITVLVYKLDAIYV